MVVGKKDFEQYLRVGLGANVNLGAGPLSEKRHKTAIRGWRKGAFLILDRPVFRRRPVTLRENQRCTVRFLSHGVACAFESVVLDWDTKKTGASFRIEWPKRFVDIKLRKQQRIQINIPCRCQLPEGTTVNGTLLDLSPAGCAALVPASPKIDTTVSLSFCLPDGAVVDGVRTRIRHVSEEEEGARVGGEFHADQPTALNDIEFYVLTSIGAKGGRRTSARLVLICDPDLEKSVHLRNVVENQGCLTLAADNLVDACFRMRMSAPMALLLNAEQGSIGAVAVCRAVRDVPDFKDLPIYVYGGQPDVIRKVAMRAGATRYIPADSLENELAAIFRPLPDSAESDE